MHFSISKKILIALSFFVLLGTWAVADEVDEWKDHLDVYNSDGLDRPVSAIEYEKTIKELDNLKKKNQKKKLKKGEMPPPSTVNEQIKLEKNDVIKITNPLYYDGQIVPVGFYKVACEESTDNYFINLMQGKNVIISVKANKVSHMDFCPDKTNCMEANVYKDKYFKINYKTIDYAVSAYFAILN